MKIVLFLLICFGGSVFGEDYPFYGIEKNKVRYLQNSKDVKAKSEYGHFLAYQERITREFLRSSNRSLYKLVQKSSTDLANIDSSYKRLSIQKVFNDNSKIINAIRKSKLSNSAYLDFKIALAILKKSRSVSRQCIEGAGVCFVKATHVAKELAENYNNLPTLKIWILGRFHKWIFHVVPIIPVRVDGVISWHAMDVIMGKPVKVDSWIAYWLAKGIKSKIRIEATYSTKFSVYDQSMYTPFSDQGGWRDQTYWEGLKAADKKQ